MKRLKNQIKTVLLLGAISAPLVGVGTEISEDPEALASALLKLERASEVIPVSEPTPDAYGRRRREPVLVPGLW